MADLDEFCAEASSEYGSGGQPTLLRQGAEARVYTGTFYGRPCLIKERFAKTYRHPDLEERLTKERLRAEVRALVRCRQLGIRVPSLYFVDPVKNMIYMEYLTDACTLREYIDRHFSAGKDLGPTLRGAATELGSVLASIHQQNIIHGDLTTSNVLVLANDADESVAPTLVLIDFGLSYVERLTEDKGVDLYVLERALISAHPDSQPLFDAMLQAYTAHNAKQAAAVIKKFEEVRARGRKRDMVG